MTEGMTGKRAGGAQTVDRALGLLRLIAAGPVGGLRLSDLAVQAGLDAATAHRLLASLIRNGFADQDAASRRYVLGLEVFSIAAAASNRFDLVAVARAALQRLSAATGDTAMLCLRSGLDVVCVDVETGSFPIRTLPMDMGSRRPIGAGASGIAVLAALPPFEAARVLERNAPRLAGVPGQDPDSLRVAVESCRAAGYALGAEEPQGRILGLAVTLHDRRGWPQSTLSLSGIPERFAGARAAELAAILATEARAIEETMRRIPDAERHNAHWSPRRPGAAGRGVAAAGDMPHHDPESAPQRRSRRAAGEGGTR